MDPTFGVLGKNMFEIVIYCEVDGPIWQQGGKGWGETSVQPFQTLLLKDLCQAACSDQVGILTQFAARGKKSTER